MRVAALVIKWLATSLLPGPHLPLVAFQRKRSDTDFALCKLALSARV